MDGQTLKTGVKKDEGKPRWDLLPYDGLEKVVDVITFGCKKYDERNWERGIAYSRVFGAAIRHSWKWFMAKLRGETGLDEESGITHLAHATCCLLFLLSYETRHMEKWDDRPTKEDK